MKSRQIYKLAFLVQVMVMGKLKKERDKEFIKRLSGLSDDIPLDNYDSIHLDAVWTDNLQFVKKLEWYQI